jgi:hypothetical protein
MMAEMRAEYQRLFHKPLPLELTLDAIIYGEVYWDKEGNRINPRVVQNHLPSEHDGKVAMAWRKSP